MKEVSLERIWDQYGNKYVFLVSASRETRQLIEAISEGRIDTVENPYRLGLMKAMQEGDKEESNE